MTMRVFFICGAAQLNQQYHSFWAKLGVTALLSGHRCTNAAEGDLRLACGRAQLHWHHAWPAFPFELGAHVDLTPSVQGGHIAQWHLLLFSFGVEI